MPGIDHRGKSFCEPRQDMACRFHILQPLALRTVFEGLGAAFLFFGSQGFEKKDRIKRHPFPLFVIGLLVMTEQFFQIPRGQMLLGKCPGKSFRVLRVGARQRRQDPAGCPGGEMTAPDRRQDLFGQRAQQRQPSAYPALVLSQKTRDFFLRQFMALVKLPDQASLL